MEVAKINIEDINPFFAVEAEQLLESGFTDEAIELCELGLQAYPNYYGAIGILNRAYNLIGEYQKAKLLLDNALIDLPANNPLAIFAVSSGNAEAAIDSFKTFDDFNELDAIDNFDINQVNSTQSKVGSTLIFPSEPVYYKSEIRVDNNFLQLPDFSIFSFELPKIKQIEDLNISIPPYFPVIKGKKVSLEIGNEEIKQEDISHTIVKSLSEFEYSEEKLEELINVFDDNVNEEDTEIESSNYNQEEELVTVTLAKIYENQELFTEAISIYEKLCIKYPIQEKNFKKEIRRIRKQISN